MISIWFEEDAYNTMKAYNQEIQPDLCEIRMDPDIFWVSDIWVELEGLKKKKANNGKHSLFHRFQRFFWNIMFFLKKSSSMDYVHCSIRGRYRLNKYFAL